MIEPDSIVHVSGASYPALVFWFELLVVALKFESSLTHHQVHFLCFEVAVLIIHQSKGNCELQIQTFREFSAQTSYSQKWSQKILLTALMFSVPSLKQKANSVYEEKKMQLI